MLKLILYYIKKHIKKGVVSSMKLFLDEKIPFEGRHYRINNGELIIKDGVDFEKIMKKFAMLNSQSNRCYYCGCKLKKNYSLDHKVPQILGGPTITNNLVLSCKKCNAGKGNLTLSEYNVYKSLVKDEDRHYFREIVKQERISYNFPFLLQEKVFPKNWIECLQFDLIKPPSNLSIKNYKKSLMFEKNKTFCGNNTTMRSLLILDKNYRILANKDIYFVYQVNKKDYQCIPVIILDNVELRNSIYCKAEEEKTFRENNMLKKEAI